MLKKSKQLLVVILSMMVCSCSEKESGNAGGGENGNPDLEPVITGGYSYDGYEKIIIEGYNNVKELPGASVSYGIMFSDTDLTTDAKTEEADEKDANNKFSCEIKVEPGGDLYYYRAYAVRSGETFYGEIKTLTTRKLVADPGPIVDMGVSVKWASCNLGATKPEECGDYYAWGTTETLYETGYAQEDPQNHWKPGKSAGYVESNYQMPTASMFDDNNNLLPEYDAAHKVLKGTWRMPTSDEFDELEENSKKYRIDEYDLGLHGIFYVSNITGKVLFFKEYKKREGKSFSEYSDLYYWSSTKYSSLRHGERIHGMFDDVPMESGYMGYNIRPVCK